MTKHTIRTHASFVAIDIDEWQARPVAHDLEGVDRRRLAGGENGDVGVGHFG